jgi:uncharacterized membrane protein YfhO
MRSVDLPAEDKISEPQYSDGMTSAEFEVDASHSGYFLLPFGYTGDIRILKNDEQLAVKKTNEWMCVIELPAGHSVVRVTVKPRQIVLRQIVDSLFILLVVALALNSTMARFRRAFLASEPSSLRF